MPWGIWASWESSPHPHAGYVTRQGGRYSCLCSCSVGQGRGARPYLNSADSPWAWLPFLKSCLCSCTHASSPMRFQTLGICFKGEPALKTGGNLNHVPIHSQGGSGNQKYQPFGFLFWSTEESLTKSSRGVRENVWLPCTRTDTLWQSCPDAQDFSTGCCSKIPRPFSPTHKMKSP